MQKAGALSFGVSFCGALFLLPALAAAQDQAPAPPKQETVTIRAVSGAFEVKGTSSADFFEFTQQCDSTQGIGVSSVLLTLPVDLRDDANDSLEKVTALLRKATAQGIEVLIEPSSEAGQVAAFYWGGSPWFRGVIESLSVKYTLFLPSGTPTRATVNLRMKQAGGLSGKKQPGEANQPGDKKKSDCSPAKQ